MTTAIRPTIAAVFLDRRNAEKALDALRVAGFPPTDLGVLTLVEGSDSLQAKAQGADISESRTEEGAIAGGVAGLGIGGAIGLGVLALAIPGIGPALAAGTLASLFAATAGGVAIAGLTGALIGWGLSEQDAAFYEKELQAGRTIVTVSTDERDDDAAVIVRQFGGYDQSTAPLASTTLTDAQNNLA
jgi:hypothetical protein